MNEEKKTWKDIRDMLGYTQQQMADLIGISRELYQMKETYKRPMKVNEAVIICKESGVDITSIQTN